MLIFLIILLVLAVIGFYLGNKFYSDIGIGVGMISTFVLVLALVLWIGFYLDNADNIRNYYATKSTIEELRKQEISDSERATISQSIIDINSWLYDAQYWNETIIGDWVPDEVMELEPLK